MSRIQRLSLSMSLWFGGAALTLSDFPTSGWLGGLLTGLSVWGFWGVTEKK